MAAIHELSAAELGAAFARGELSPVDVARAQLERIAHWEPPLPAISRVGGGRGWGGGSSGQARWGAAGPRSALGGVPIAHKENIYTRGDPAAIGTRANEDA